MDNKLEQAVETARVRAEKKDSSTTSWEFDKYFAQIDGVYRQEHVIYKRRERGVERTTITRRYYAGGDYQDSTETVIL